jgi:signal transduction histidine kinase
MKKSPDLREDFRDLLHDISTPLSIIKMYTKRIQKDLLEEKSSPEDVLLQLQKLEDAMNDIDRITNECKQKIMAQEPV